MSSRDLNEMRRLRVGLALAGGAAARMTYAWALASVLSAAQLGTYFLAFSWLSITSLVTLHGAEPVVLRTLSPLEGQRDRWRPVIDQVLHRVWIVSAAAGLPIALGGVVMWAVSGDERWIDAVILGVLLPLHNRLVAFAAVIRVGNRPILSTALRVVIPYVVALLAVGAAHMVGASLRSGLLPLLTGVLVALIVAERRVRRDVPPAAPDSRTAVDWTPQSGVHFAGAALSTSALDWVDVTVVAVIAGTEAAAVYGLAKTFVSPFNLLLQSSAIGAGPVLANQIGRGRSVAAWSTYRRLLTSLVVAALSLYCALIVVDRVLLSTLAPVSWGREATVTLLILAAGRSVHAACGPVAMFVNLLGREREVLTVSLVALVVGLAAMLGFGVVFGVAGVALGATLSLIAKNVVLVWRARTVSAPGGELGR